MGRRSVLAGIVGYGWASVLQLVATPLLLKLLGPESFGLVGLYLALQGIAQIFDFGLSPSVNREMSRARAEGRAEDAHDLLRTIEPGYWGLGLLLGGLAALMAPLVGSHWAATSGLSASTIHRDVLLIALLVAVRWPITLYEGGLTGLQRIATLHLVGIALQGAGVVGGLLLIYLGPRQLSAYLLVQAAAGLAQALLLAILLRRALPRIDRRARPRTELVIAIWRFAAGMSLLMVLSAVLVHTDKLILSRMLSLRDYGYYTLASFVGASLYVLILPVFHASVPVLSARVARDDDAGVRTVYHLTSQSLAVLVIPAAAVLALFAEPLLAVWTRDAATAHAAAPIARLLVIGTAINGLTGAHYALQIAYGQPKIGIVIHIGLIAVFLPAIILAASARGTLGAASVWIGLNLLYMGVVVPFTHARLMRGEALRWLVRDVLPPSVAGVAAAVVGWRLATSLSVEPQAAFFGSVATLTAAWAAATFAAPRVRMWLLPSLLGRHQSVLP